MSSGDSTLVAKRQAGEGYPELAVCYGWEALALMRRTGLAIAAACLMCALTACTPKSGPVATASSRAASPSLTVTAPAEVADQVAKARAMLAKVRIGGRGAQTGYQRTEDFGAAWLDVDGNGCRTRDDVLARDLVVTARRNRCVVTAGTFTDPYSGKSMTFSKARADDVQIDHLVPLGLAWQLGAPQWTLGQRVAFANDPEELLAVNGGLNQAKGDSGPDSWLPPDRTYRCTYVIRFTRVAYTYGLRITPSMRDAINRQLDTCRMVVGDPADLQPLPAEDWPRAERLAQAAR